MEFISNPYIVSNLYHVTRAFFYAFIIALLITPLVGFIAKKFNVVDLGVDLRKKGDGVSKSRIHTGAKLRLGGLAVAFSFFIVLLGTGRLSTLGFGIPLALLIVIITGFLEDKFEISGQIQILGQLLAAAIVVISGISVTQVSFLNQIIRFDQFSTLITVGDFVYNFIFPADILTVLWIVGIMNIINWVGGVDGLNISVTSIIAFTMMVLALNSTNVGLAIIIAIFIGANLGLLPFNYNPSLIFPGGIGDYMNGFLLAIFAILGGTTWNSTIVLLGLPIIDALLVVYLRVKSNPEVRKNPLKILSVSDQNHLQHRLLEVGYSRKMVLLIEVSIMAVISTIAISFSNLREDRFTAILALIGFTLILVIFTVVNFQRQKARNYRERLKLQEHHGPKPVVNVIVKQDGQEESDYERFIY